MCKLTHFNGFVDGNVTLLADEIVYDSVCHDILDYPVRPQSLITSPAASR